MAVKIVWMAGAERDLLDLYQQMLRASEEDPELISRVLERPLESNLRLLSRHPEIGPKVRGTRRVRRRVLGPGNRYGLFYVVEARGVFIHALLDLRQDPEKIWQRLREI